MFRVFILSLSFPMLICVSSCPKEWSKSVGVGLLCCLLLEREAKILTCPMIV